MSPRPQFGSAIYEEIAAERERAHAKHGPRSMESYPPGAFIRYTILAEEVGEIAKEFNEAEARGGQHRLDLERLRTECIQAAAMASAWADRLGVELGLIPPRLAGCNATLAGRGVVPCTSETPHIAPSGCRFELVDQADAVHHDHHLQEDA